MGHDAQEHGKPKALRVIVFNAGIASRRRADLPGFTWHEATRTCLGRQPSPAEVELYRRKVLGQIARTKGLYPVNQRLPD